MVLRECPQKLVKSPVHQQDKYSRAGCRQGGVKSLCDLDWKARNCKMGKELSEENVVLKEDNGLGEGGIVLVEIQIEDPFIENGIHEDIDQQDFSLGNREMEEVDWDLIGGGVQDEGHAEDGRTMLMQLAIDEDRRGAEAE